MEVDRDRCLRKQQTHFVVSTLMWLHIDEHSQAVPVAVVLNKRAQQLMIPGLVCVLSISQISGLRWTVGRIPGLAGVLPCQFSLPC